MKKLLILILFLPLLGCANIVKNKPTFSDFNCPQVFFSTEDRVYVQSSKSLEDVSIQAKFNNFTINKNCQKTDEIIIIPLDILIIAKPFGNLEKPKFEIPIYISLLDKYDNILETQYFMISSFFTQDNITDSYIDSDIKKRLRVVTPYFSVNQVVIGFMLDYKQRELLN